MNILWVCIQDLADLDLEIPSFLSVLVWVSIIVKRHHDHVNSYKGNHLVGVGLDLRGLVCYLNGRKHGDTEVGMALER